MPGNTVVERVELPNGATAYMEVRSLGGAQRASGSPLPKFDELAASLEGIAATVKKSIEQLKPSKTAVELGVEVGLESGQLTAIFVKGTGTANLKVTLEWGVDR